jgi:phosphatidylglycerol---prolipoprotein diacylglyceryl transferase
MPYCIIPAIQIGPLHFGTWGLLVGLGLVAGFLAALWAARRRGLPSEKLYTLTVAGVVGGIVGSKLVWAVQPSEIGQTLAHPLRLIAVWQGGLTLVGGLVIGFGAAAIYAWRARLPVRKTLDVVALGLGPAVAIGRIGCYLTGLHPGKVTTLPWGIYLDGAIRHPIPLYESLLGIALFVFALFLFRRRLPAGVSAVATGGTYLVLRSLLDLLRASGVDGPNVLVLGGFTLTQAVTVFVVPLMAAVAFWMARSTSCHAHRVA